MNNVLKSVEELLVITAPPVYSDPGDTTPDMNNNGSPTSLPTPLSITGFVDGNFGILNVNDYIAVYPDKDNATPIPNQLDPPLKGKNKVLIAKRYSEDDIRITEFQIRNLRAMTKREPRDMKCALVNFQLADANISPKDSTFTTSALAEWKLHDDYFVRIHSESPFTEDTLAFNETILVPAGTRLVPLTAGNNLANHLINVKATVYHFMMKTLLARSRREGAMYTPYLVNANYGALATIDSVGTQVKAANLYDELDVANNFGMVNANINDYAIVLVGGYLDISKSVHGVYNKFYRKRRVYNLKLGLYDYDKGGHMTVSSTLTLTRSASEAVGLGIDLQQVELFDSGNFDKWGTPNYRSTVDGEPFIFDFKVDPKKKYTQYLIESYNEDVNGENRMYRHPVQWRLLVEYVAPTGQNGAHNTNIQAEANYVNTCQGIEDLFNSIDQSDVRIKSTELSADTTVIVTSY